MFGHIRHLLLDVLRSGFLEQITDYWKLYHPILIPITDYRVYLKPSIYHVAL